MKSPSESLRNSPISPRVAPGVFLVIRQHRAGYTAVLSTSERPPRERAAKPTQGGLRTRRRLAAGPQALGRRPMQAAKSAPPAARKDLGRARKTPPSWRGGLLFADLHEFTQEDQRRDDDGEDKEHSLTSSVLCKADVKPALCEGPAHAAGGTVAGALDRIGGDILGTVVKPRDAVQSAQVLRNYGSRPAGKHEGKV